MDAQESSDEVSQLSDIYAELRTDAKQISSKG